MDIFMRCIIMKEYDVKKLIENKLFLDLKLNDALKSGLLFKEDVDSRNVKGHLLKSTHNLDFVNQNIKLKFYDWSVVGCYYAVYHSALGLILSKGYSSKNHLATLCVLIKEFYEEGLNLDDVNLLANSLDYQDVLFYVEAKNKREDASYSTNLLFDKTYVENLHLKTILFVNKAKDILGI